MPSSDEGSRGDDGSAGAAIGRGSCEGIFRPLPRHTFSLDPYAASSLTPQRNESSLDNFEVFSLAYSNDSRLLAAAGSTGSIHVFASDGEAHLCSLMTEAQTLPITCCRFRPPTALGGASHVLTAASADCSVTQWHVPSQTCIYKFEEPDNQVILSSPALTVCSVRTGSSRSLLT